MKKPLPAWATNLTATTRRGSGQLDALVLTPLLSMLVTDGAGHGAALVNSVTGATRHAKVTVSGTGPTVATSYDAHGRLWRIALGAGTVTVAVPAGGFAIALR